MNRTERYNATRAQGFHCWARNVHEAGERGYKDTRATTRGAIIAILFNIHDANARGHGRTRKWNDMQIALKDETSIDMCSCLRERIAGKLVGIPRWYPCVSQSYEVNLQARTILDIYLISFLLYSSHATKGLCARKQWSKRLFWKNLMEYLFREAVRLIVDKNFDEWFRQ